MVTINTIYNMDCVTGMHILLGSNCVDLIVTSPPYKEEDGYDTNLIRSVAYECYRVLKTNGLCYVNFGHLAHQKLRPFDVAYAFAAAGFELVDTLIWRKNHYRPLQGNKRVNNVFEFIFQFAKGDGYTLDRLAIGEPYKDKSNVGRYSDKDLKCAGNTWTDIDDSNYWEIPYDTVQRSDQKRHNDRFPIGLPEKCIKLSNLSPGSLILDPFMGSGTTARAAKNLGHCYVGFERNPKHVETAIKWLAE